jgi:hypothetical protein
VNVTVSQQRLQQYHIIIIIPSSHSINAIGQQRLQQYHMSHAFQALRARTLSVAPSYKQKPYCFNPQQYLRDQLPDCVAALLRTSTLRNFTRAA